MTGGRERDDSWELTGDRERDDSWELTDDREGIASVIRHLSSVI